jgi:hypothetical protein
MMTLNISMYAILSQPKRRTDIILLQLNQHGFDGAVSIHPRTATRRHVGGSPTSICS